MRDLRRFNRRHRLLDILVIAVAAVLGGADDWVDIEAFGRAKRRWFASFLALPHGIPSHDSFRRVFLRLRPEELQRSFLRWIEDLRAWLAGEVVAIDGKTARRSADWQAGGSALHTVSAWAAGHRLVLAQVAVEEKSNEIRAIPELLGLLAVQDNQPDLHEALHRFFAEAPAVKGEVWASDAVGWLAEESQWPRLSSIALVRASREVDGSQEVKDRYYRSVRGKRLLAGWDSGYLEQVPFGRPSLRAKCVCPAGAGRGAGAGKVRAESAGTAGAGTGRARSPACPVAGLTLYPASIMLWVTYRLFGVTVAHSVHEQPQGKAG